MDIIKQHVVLNLVRSGRYELNHETGEILSNIGKDKRSLSPIEHYTGYLQYALDIGFNARIMVYGQVFSYLAKWLTTYDPKMVIDHKDKVKQNNRPDNLQCVSEQVNNGDNGGSTRGKTIKRVRLPIDQKEAIRLDFESGISMTKLAIKYGTTRQTVSKIVNVK